MSWTVQADAPIQTVGQQWEALALELDPRTRVVRLGLRPLGATSQEVDGGAVLRRYLDTPVAEWSPVEEWLVGAEAAALLSTITAGYTAEQAWTGDWTAAWTADAWTAANELHEAVEALLHAQTPPAMRTVRIQDRSIRGLTDREPAASWLARLTQAGLMFPEEPSEPDTPQADMDQIFHQTMAFCDLEDQIQHLQFSTQRMHNAPWYSGVILVTIYGFSLLWALGADDSSDRLWRFGWVWILLGIGAVGVIVGLKRVTARREHDRQASLRLAKQLASDTRDEILKIRDRLLTRTFAAVVKQRMLVHTPHIDWLERGLREVPAENADLRDRLTAAQEQIRKTVKCLAVDPPQTWTQAGLTADLAALAAAMEAAGIDRIPPLPQATG